MPAQRAKLHPVAHAGATVLLAGACVGGYLVSGQDTTADPAVALGDTPTGDQGTRLLADHLSVGAAQIDTGAELSGPVGSVQEAGEGARTARAEGLAAAASAAEQARTRAAQDAAAQAAAAETERAAREAQRQEVLAKARQDPRAVARIMVAERGWDEGQFQCLNKLWQKESNWTYTARNRSSGAYGIPQALPATKMASAGSDWQSNPITQIKWGLGYIATVYGTPCNAWAHSVRVNWY